MHLRVVVADDNDAFLAAARDALTAAAGIDVVATVGSGPRVIEACAQHRPDVVVLDVQMPGGGPDLAAEIARQWPATQILCLSAQDDADTVLRMLASGATGYVAKGALDEDLATVVQRAADGWFFVTASCADEVHRRIGELRGRAGNAP